MAGRCGLPLAQALTPARQASLRHRLQECGGLAGWQRAVEKLAASDFCRGQNEYGWKAGLDFVLQAKSFTRLLEGRYDNRTPPKASMTAAFDRLDARLRRLS